LGEDRVAELSRMLAGVEDSAHARRHAEELLSEATTSGPRSGAAAASKSKASSKTKPARARSAR
jgi:hypothetical protein